MPVTLKNWKVIYKEADDYLPPEMRPQYLNGEVFGHHRCQNGEKVCTSSIVDVNGKFITTSSGTVYQLLEPDAEYAQWVFETRGYSIDPENPIKVKF